MRPHCKFKAHKGSGELLEYFLDTVNIFDKMKHISNVKRGLFHLVKSLYRAIAVSLKPEQPDHSISKIAPTINLKIEVKNAEAQTWKK
jgi:hypothetical protein